MFIFLAGILFLTVGSITCFPSNLPAKDHEPLAGVAVLEGEVYYWPVLSEENEASDYRLVILERDMKKISFLTGIELPPQSSEIPPESNLVLNKLAEILIANPDLFILIAVRSEKPGKSPSGFNLAWQKANQIKDYLISLGIDSSRITTRGSEFSAGERTGRGKTPVEINITEQDQDLSPKWMNLKKNTDFYALDEIKTGKGKVKILFPSGAIISLGPQTYLKIIDANRIWLYRGGLLVNLEGVPAGSEFITETANVIASMVGSNSIIFFSDGVSTLNTLKGEIAISRKTDSGNILRLERGKTVVFSNNREPGRPESANPQEVRNLLNEFTLKNFDSSQSLYDEEIIKRLEMNQPVAPGKKPAPAPAPENQVTSPPSATQAVTPSP